MISPITGKRFALADYARTLPKPIQGRFAHFALNTGRSTPETLRVFKVKFAQGRV